MLKIIRNNLPILEEDPYMKIILETSQIIKISDKSALLNVFLPEYRFPGKTRNQQSEKMQQT